MLCALRLLESGLGEIILADPIWRIPSISDEAAVRFFEHLQTQFSMPRFQVSASNYALGEFASVDLFFRNFDFIDWAASRVVSAIHAPVEGDRIFIDFSRPTTTEAEISIRRNSNQTPDAAVWLKVLDRVRRFVDATLASNPSGLILPADDAVSVQFAQLHELHTRILYDAEKARIDAEAKFTARIAELEADFDRRRAALDEVRSEEEARVNQIESELIASRKALDDRNHMHVRRDLRSQITDDIKERLSKPGVSRQANLLRVAIGGLSLLAIVAFVAYAGVAALDLHTLIAEATKYRSSLDPSSPPTLVVTVPVLVLAGAKLLLSVAAATGLLFYLLGWLRRLHFEDVRAERELERYRYDVDRASWVVETLLEAKTGTADVPKEWIEGVTRNMFSRNEMRDDDHSALEAVAALLGASAEADLGPTGVSLKLRRDGLRKLSKANETNN